MTRVCVGVHVHAEPELLHATIAALESPARRPVEILLLPDGADSVTRAALAALGRLPQSPARGAAGPPACFNRLAAESDADVVVLLESGAIPAPGALDLLVDALERDARTGLAGPSTNSSWNEQGVFETAGGSPAEVERTGREATRRFGGAIRDLAPLHSLADFCYAVRRDVVDAVGGADEGFGLGPCWEMEYSARAVRAGFRAVWVCAAYVYRAPFSARRRRAEERLFDASRRRYQDALCGLRLRGERAGYEPHCRGEACEHFAPRDLVRIRRPLPPAPPRQAPAVAPTLPSYNVSQGRSGPPLVTCVMPTRDRPDFVLHAVRLFERQDYPSRELVVVGEEGDRLDALLPDDPRIRYVAAQRGESIGAKRNRACTIARGEFVAQWDDDDWYGAGRLSAQLAPLLAGRADVTALTTPVFFELPAWRFWAVTPALHRRLFVEDVHGGTLVYARRVWERLARYPDASLAEDAAFLRRAKARGARIERVDGAGHFVYLRHAANAWSFACGTHVDRSGWRQVAEPALPPEDRAFYAARAERAPAAAAGEPLVSCIMPTADRRDFVARSIGFFLRQDYPRRELLVLDDGGDRLGDVLPADPRIRYVPLERRLVLGEKRNRACELAQGEIVVHWDDDDWQAPHRLRYQVGELQHHGAGVCGPNRVLYFDPAAARAWLYEYPESQRRWIAGNALCYRKEVWHENPFAHVQVGEDTRFVWSPRVGTPLVLPDHRFLAGLVHAANTSRKLTSGAYWHTRPLGEVTALLGDDYRLF